MTNRYFTEQAKRLAKANDVTLWNRDQLVHSLLESGDRDADHATPIEANG